MTNRQVQCICLPVIFFGLLGNVFVAAQKTGTRPRVEASKDADHPISRKRPPEIVNLITVVQWAPPEFAADMLITIADSTKVTEADWKKELLKEAFRVAAECQHRMPSRDIGRYTTETRVVSMSEAFQLKLDTLSLRCRAIQSMLLLDKPTARQLFSEMEKFRFPSVGCAEGLVSEVSEFYTTAAQLVEEAFTPQELKTGEHMRLLDSLIESISSPLQIAPAANLIRSLHSLRASQDQRETLVAALAARIGKVSGDDRSFSVSMQSVGYEIGRLLDSCIKERVTTSELIRELRSYYVRHFGANRCSDTLRNTDDTGALPREVVEFNTRLRALSEKEIPEIEADEVKPSKIEGKVDAHVYWESAGSKRLLQDTWRLRHGNGETHPSDADRESPEWRQSLREFLIRLSDWQGDETESPEDYYYEKSSLLEGLLMARPPLARGQERDEAIRQFVSLLSSFDAKNLSRIEWFSFAKELLFPQSFSESGGENGTKMRTLLESSNNTVLSAYAQLWKTLSSPAPLKTNARRPPGAKP